MIPKMLRYRSRFLLGIPNFGDYEEFEFVAEEYQTVGTRGGGFLDPELVTVLINDNSRLALSRTQHDSLGSNGL